MREGGEGRRRGRGEGTNIARENCFFFTVSFENNNLGIRFC